MVICTVFTLSYTQDLMLLTFYPFFWRYLIVLLFHTMNLNPIAGKFRIELYLNIISMSETEYCPKHDVTFTTVFFHNLIKFYTIIACLHLN